MGEHGAAFGRPNGFGWITFPDSVPRGHGYRDDGDRTVRGVAPGAHGYREAVVTAHLRGHPGSRPGDARRGAGTRGAAAALTTGTVSPRYRFAALGAGGMTFVLTLAYLVAEHL